MKILAAFSLLRGISLTGCSLVGSPDKAEPTLVLPPATAVGANTLGFEIDGRVWTTYGQYCTGLFGGNCKNNFLYASSYRFPGGRRKLSISTSLDTHKYHESFELEIDTLRGPGVYSAGLARTFPISALGKNLYDPSLTDGNNQYFYVGGASNSVRIVLTRVDTVQRIVSGTFEGRLEDISAPGKYVAIRQGRFDVTYYR